MWYCNGSKNNSDICLFKRLCSAEKLDCTTSEDIENGRMVCFVAIGEHCLRDDDGFYEDTGVCELYCVEKDGAIGWYENHDVAKKIETISGGTLKHVTCKKEINKVLKHIDYTSGYERCLTCRLMFKSWAHRGECSIHWRPFSGTKYGFPIDGWHCPMDSFEREVES